MTIYFFDDFIFDELQFLTKYFFLTKYSFGETLITHVATWRLIEEKTKISVPLVKFGDQLPEPGLNGTQEANESSRESPMPVVSTNTYHQLYIQSVQYDWCLSTVFRVNTIQINVKDFKMDDELFLQLSQLIELVMVHATMQYIFNYHIYSK